MSLSLEEQGVASDQSRPCFMPQPSLLRSGADDLPTGWCTVSGWGGRTPPRGRREGINTVHCLSCIPGSQGPALAPPACPLLISEGRAGHSGPRCNLVDLSQLKRDWASPNSAPLVKPGSSPVH